MARIRSVHPGLFTDEAFMSVSIEARMLLIGIWTEAYDDGVFEWKPLTLKARLFPVDGVDIEALLSELTGAGMIARITDHPKQPGIVRNFQRYQRPKKPNSSGMLPDHWLVYAGRAGTDKPSSRDSAESVRNPYGTGGEKSSQMEDGGWKEPSEGKNGFSDGSSTAPVVKFPHGGAA